MSATTKRAKRKAAPEPIIVWLVYEFDGVPDAIYDNEDEANDRLAELDHENGGEFGSVVPFTLNTPNGVVAC